MSRFDTICCRVPEHSVVEPAALGHDYTLSLSHSPPISFLLSVFQQNTHTHTHTRGALHIPIGRHKRRRRRRSAHVCQKATVTASHPGGGQREAATRGV